MGHGRNPKSQATNLEQTQNKIKIQNEETRFGFCISPFVICLFFGA
jgi:hypothetical protein